MSKCFIEGMGGASKNVPSIFAIYPEGAICTCTNGEKVYKAKDTSGYWYFAGLEVGVWTVTIEDPMGENIPISETAEITATNQGVVVSLIFWDGSLYNKGDINKITGGWKSISMSNGDKYKAGILQGGDQGTYIHISAGYVTNSYSVAGYGPVNPVDITPYKTLTINVTSNGTSSYCHHYLCVYKLGATSWSGNVIAETALNRTGNITLDVSSISGEVGIAIRMFNEYSVQNTYMNFDFLGVSK